MTKNRRCLWHLFLFTGNRNAVFKIILIFDRNFMYLEVMPHTKKINTTK